MHYRTSALLVGLLFALYGSAGAQQATGPYIQVSPTPSKLSVGGPGFVQIDAQGVASIAAAAPGSGNVTSGSPLDLNHMVVGNGGADIKTLGGTVGGAFTTAGAFTTTGAVSGVTLAFPSGGPFTYTFPFATATLASLAGSETFTNKIYSGGQLSGSFSGNPTFLGIPLFTNLSAGTQTTCLGLDSTFHLVTSAGACGSGAGGITQLTGDVTAGPGSGSQAATLANTAVTPASYTNTNLTVDSKGRITAASNGSAGSATGSGVDGGTSAQSLTGTATISNGTRLVKVASGWVTGTLTLPAISAVSTDTCIRIEDGGNFIDASHTLTVKGGVSDGLNGGAANGTIGPFTTAGSFVIACVSAANNWNVGPGTIAVSSAPANQFANGVTVNGLTYAQPSVSNISGFGTGVATWLGTPSKTNFEAALTGAPFSPATLGGSAASHAVPVDVAGTSTYKVIPDCTDTGGNHINYTQSTDAFSCGTSSSGGGGGAVTLISTISAPASTGCNGVNCFAWTGLTPAANDVYNIECHGVKTTSGTANIAFQLGTGATSWQTGASAYTYSQVGTGTTSTSTDSGMPVAFQPAVGALITVQNASFYDLASTSLDKVYHSNVSFVSTNPVQWFQYGRDTADATSAITAIRLVDKQTTPVSLSAGICSLFKKAG